MDNYDFYSEQLNKKLLADYDKLADSKKAENYDPEILKELSGYDYFADFGTSNDFYSAVYKNDGPESLALKQYVALMSFDNTLDAVYNTWKKYDYQDNDVIFSETAEVIFRDVQNNVSFGSRNVPINVHYDRRKIGEEFALASAGYISSSEYDRLFYKSDPRLMEYRNILEGHHAISSVEYVCDKNDGDSLVFGLTDMSDTVKVSCRSESEIPYFEYNSSSIDPRATWLVKSIENYLNTSYEALNDFRKGKPFPGNEVFSGVQKFRILNEFNNTVLGVRAVDEVKHLSDGRTVHIADYSYATWSGSSTAGVSNGHYDMSKHQAYEDFAERSGLIDREAYSEKIMNESLMERLNIDVHHCMYFSVLNINGEKILSSLDPEKDEIYNCEELHDYFSYNYYNGDFCDVSCETFKLGSGNKVLIPTEEELSIIDKNLDRVSRLSEKTGEEEFNINVRLIKQGGGISY